MNINQINVLYFIMYTFPSDKLEIIEKNTFQFILVDILSFSEIKNYVFYYLKKKIEEINYYRHCYIEFI